MTPKTPEEGLDLDAFKARAEALVEATYDPDAMTVLSRQAQPVAFDTLKLIAEVERLRTAPPTDRLRELAIEAARRKHLRAVRQDGGRLKPEADWEGHRWLGGGDIYEGFATCPHSDCVLVRAPGAAQPAKESK